MEITDALAQTFDHTAEVVAGIKPAHMDAATPCEQWNVRDLLAHTMGVIATMGRGARGEELLADMNAFPLDADVSAQFRAEADRTLAAWRAHGLDGEVTIAAGPMPARLAATINLVDTTTHAWDLAKATKQDVRIPDALAADVLVVAKGFIDENVRKRGGFSPAVPVPSDAAPEAQLAAFLGRQP